MKIKYGLIVLFIISCTIGILMASNIFKCVVCTEEATFIYYGHSVCDKHFHEKRKALEENEKFMEAIREHSDKSDEIMDKIWGLWLEETK